MESQSSAECPGLDGCDSESRIPQPRDTNSSLHHDVGSKIVNPSAISEGKSSRVTGLTIFNAKIQWVELVECLKNFEKSEN